MDKILQTVNEHGLLNQVSVSQVNQYLFDKKPAADLTTLNNSSFELTIPKSVTQAKVNEIKQIIGKLQLNISISHKIGLNSQMPHYNDLHQVLSEGAAELVHKHGQVLLVDVWATWCGPCQKPMQHNQEMLEKNAETWKDKVRIVAVSVDEQREVLKNRVNAKGWTKIEHLTLLGWKGEHPLISDFDIQGIPFVFLVNKEGKIDFYGHPSEINLEKRINELIDLQPQVKQEVHQEVEGISQSVTDEISKKQAVAKIFTKQVLQEKFGKAQVFQVIADIKTNINRGRVENTPSKLKIAAYEDDVELIQEFKTILKDIDPTIFEVEENLVKYTLVSDITNAECTDCKAVLSYPFYWCRWDSDPNSFRCRACVEKPSQEEGLHYAYAQNSVLLGGEWKKIALKGLGINIQPQKGKFSQLKPHGFGCNGCGGCPASIGQARYICLGCRNDPNTRGDYIDLCDKCLVAYFSGQENVRTELHNQGHKENHPLLRILYKVDGYYNF